MFVNKHAFLLSVSNPLGMLTVNHLGKNVGGRCKASIRKALFSQFAVYKSQSLAVTTLLSDGEGAIASLHSEIHGLGISVNPNGANKHVGTIERNIRVVKERVRGITSTLPYLLACSLLPWLINFVVTKINLVPRTGGLIHLSPREAFFGVKTDFKRDLRCGFGDYLECSVPDPDNSIKPRTQACIALCPLGLQGAVKCFSLDSRKV